MSYYNKNLKPDEVIVEIVKKYYLTFLGQCLVSFILILLPFFLLYLLFQWGKWGLIIFGLLVLIGLISFARLMINYYFNNLIITTQRVIYYQQRGLFHRLAFEVMLDKIQDISYEIKGLIQTIFKYGTIKIQVINSNTLIRIDKIKNPEKIQNLINKTKENFQQDDRSSINESQLIEILRNLKEKFGEEKIKRLL